MDLRHVPPMTCRGQPQLSFPTVLERQQPPAQPLQLCGQLMEAHGGCFGCVRPPYHGGPHQMAEGGRRQGGMKRPRADEEQG